MNKSELAPTPGPSPVRKEREQGRGDVFLLSENLRSAPSEASVYPTEEGWGKGANLYFLNASRIFSSTASML